MMKDYIHESKNLVEKGINSWNQTISRMELIKVMAKAAVDQHRCINIFYEVSFKKLKFLIEFKNIG